MKLATNGVNFLMAKKLIIIAVIILASWGIIDTTKKYRNFFPIGKVFPIEMFLSDRADLPRMLSFTSDYFFDEVKRIMTGYDLWVFAAPEKDRNRFSEHESSKIPTMCLYARTEIIGNRAVVRYVSLEYNKSFENLILGEKPNFSLPESMKGKYKVEISGPEMSEIYPWKKLLGLINNFQIEDYEKLKKEFPGITYNFEETRLILSNGIAIYAVHAIADVFTQGCSLGNFTESLGRFGRSKDEFNNLALMPYSIFFQQKMEKEFWWMDLRYKSIAPVSFLLICLVVPLLFYKGKRFVINEESVKRIREMNFSFRLKVWRVLLADWIYSIYPFRTRRTAELIQKIFADCEKEQDEKLKVNIFIKAVFVGNHLEREIGEDEFHKDRYLLTLLKMAKGEENKANTGLAYRRNALALLEKTLNNLRQRKASSFLAIVPRACVPAQNKKAKDQCFLEESVKLDKRRVALGNLENLLPKTCSLDFSLWNLKSLEKLCTTVVVLRQMNSDLVHIFLARPDILELIEKRQEFFDAILVGRGEEVERILIGNGQAKKVTPAKEELLDWNESFLPTRCLDPNVPISYGNGFQKSLDSLPRGAKEKVIKSLVLLEEKGINYPSFKAKKRYDGRWQIYADRKIRLFFNYKESEGGSEMRFFKIAHKNSLK